LEYFKPRGRRGDGVPGANRGQKTGTKSWVKSGRLKQFPEKGEKKKKTRASKTSQKGGGAGKKNLKQKGTVCVGRGENTGVGWGHRRAANVEERRT